MASQDEAQEQLREYAQQTQSHVTYVPNWEGIEYGLQQLRFAYIMVDHDKAERELKFLHDQLTKIETSLARGEK